MRSQPQMMQTYQRGLGTYMPSFYYGLILLGISSCIVLMTIEGIDLTFLILLTLSGALGASDFIDALRGRRDLFSARALVSAVMLHTSYIAPLMHIGLESYPRFIVLPMNMESAFFDQGIMQLACMLVYFIFVRVFQVERREETFAKDRALAPDPVRRALLTKSLVGLGLVSLLIFMYTVLSAGGPTAWMDSQLTYRDGLSSPGWVISLAEAFPSLFLIAYVVSLSAKRNLTRKQLIQRVVFALTIFVAVTFITSGLRGSRANLVWPTLTAVVLVHIIFFKIKFKFLVIIAACGIVFAGTYDIYKKGGVEAIQEVQQEGLNEYSQDSAHSFGISSVLMGDFSRSAIQAVVLDRWNNEGFRPYFGATYLGDILLFIPGADPPKSLPDKSLAATEVLYGEGAAQYTDYFSTRIYGLQGEALMNFGPVGSILIFVPYAFIVARVDDFHARAVASQEVVAAIVYAVVLPAVLLLYLSDFDNVLRNLTSNALLPTISLILAPLVAKRRTRSRMRPGTNRSVGR